MDTDDRIEELSTLFAFLADHDFRGYSPLYEQIARTMADDRRLLTFVDEAASPNARRGRVPVLFHASLHDLTLTHPELELSRAFTEGAQIDLAAAISDAIDTHGDELIATMRTRSVQTNEVGRSAAIAAGLAAIDTGGRRIALVELGPSAGLNLFVDRWHVEYRRDGAVVATTGPEASTVRLSCELRGPLDPPFGSASPIAMRTGVDPSPIDASDPKQAQWLRACVWPGVPERDERLAAALAVVGLEPPPLVRGDAVADLAPLVASVDPDLFPVVLSTWALAYVSAEGRATIAESLDRIGASRDLALLTLEEPRFTPHIPVTDAEVAAAFQPGDGTPTVLGRRVWHRGHATSTALALCHPHARWMRWIDGGE